MPCKTRIESRAEQYLQHPLRKRIYTDASTPLSSLKRSSGKDMACLIQLSGNPRGSGGEGFLVTVEDNFNTCLQREIKKDVLGPRATLVEAAKCDIRTTGLTSDHSTYYPNSHVSTLPIPSPLRAKCPRPLRFLRIRACDVRHTVKIATAMTDWLIRPLRQMCSISFTSTTCTLRSSLTCSS